MTLRSTRCALSNPGRWRNCGGFRGLGSARSSCMARRFWTSWRDFETGCRWEAEHKGKGGKAHSQDWLRHKTKRSMPDLELRPGNSGAQNWDLFSMLLRAPTLEAVC